jgi:hypothetical protein
MPSSLAPRRRGRVLAFVALALALAAAPRPALAWNKAGHMVTGVLAYRTLASRDPAVAARIVELLKQHPDYEKSWLPLIQASGLAHDEMLFALAARWPDDVRNDPNFHRGSWHYVNFPLVAPGDTTRPPAANAGDLLNVLPKTIAVLRDSLTPAPQKAIALCWLFHLTGDIHQPLHAVSLFGERWPQGDRGGNLFWVKPGVVDRAVNLHAFWDDVVLPDEDARPAPVGEAASRLAKAFPRDALATEVAVLDPIVWARDESLAIARADAYRDFGMPGAAQADRAPIVPSGYKAAVRAVAERRLTLASYRLAEELSAALR